MKISFISHATLCIEYRGKKLVTDPWVKGSAYCGQWHLFPKPLSPEKIQDADFVFYSHGHEDHLHAESLNSMQKKAVVYYPYSWYGGTKEFFHALGFRQVQEVLNEKTVYPAEDIKVTFLANNLDNVMVFELGDKVIVNINDALPSASEAMINHMLQRIKSKWKKIDYLFSSYGGASYFPNTVHYAGKNEKDIAETRELFFLNNFCKIASSLQPAFAIPFASDFVLLDHHQRWINACKLPRSKLGDFFKSYLAQHHAGAVKTELIEIYPDDYFDGEGFHGVSPYHQKVAERALLERVDEDYAAEIKAKKKALKKDRLAVAKTFEAVKSHILQKQYIIPPAIRSKIRFAIRFTDAAEHSELLVDFRQAQTQFATAHEAFQDLDLRIDISAEALLYSIENEWGGDALIIGYAAEIYLFNKEAVSREYENFCVRVLSRYPNTREYLKKTPFRALRYLFSDPVKRGNLLGKILHKPQSQLDYTDARLNDRELWLNKDKCEVCKA
ncbi:MAG TPA: MBL fold metallo-hydrolase, partial [Bacteroidia bacterium]|nr:MBL fold metallo-hydrolase [Bacteroidia bacterium]